MKRPDYARVTSRSFKPRHWLLTRLHDTWPARRLVRRLLKLCKSYYNSDGHIMRNGEDWLLGQLMEHYRAQSISPVAFDVGANNGFWTWRLLSRDPALQVHCFEPVPETFGELAGNFKDEACVHLHDFGLSDCSETVEFWRNRKPGAASRYRDRKSDGGKYADVELRRGDGFLEDMEIDKLHILKVDAEGMDYQVLLGLGPHIESGAIDVIQFEWDLFDLETASLKDYYRLLRGQYELGRLYPSWVDFGPWRPTAENFFGGNYVAVSRRLPELVARLRKRGRGGRGPT